MKTESAHSEIFVRSIDTCEASQYPFGSLVMETNELDRLFVHLVLDHRLKDSVSLPDKLE